MFNRGIHVQVLQLRLFAGYDHIDIVAAAQAVVGHRQQRIGIGREVDANDVGLLIDHVIDKARVLVRKTIVVLPPDVRGQQVVEGGNGPPPGNVCRGGFELLGVLVEHRVDDVDKGLVGGEEAVASGEQIPLEPALTGMFTKDFHHPPMRRQMVILWDDVGHPGPLRDLKEGAEAV